MIFDEFTVGIVILQRAFEGNYKKETLDFIFDRVKERTAEDWVRVCEMLVTQAERLPAAWKILQTFPPTVEKQETNLGLPPSYWITLNARHAEYERVVGESFENFVRYCDGNKALAALHFGRAYWNARGIAKHNDSYDKLIKLCDKENVNKLLPLESLPAEAR